MQVEMIILLLGAAVTALGYIAKTLHSMDKSLGIVASKIDEHDEDIKDLQKRVRDIEINY